MNKKIIIPIIILIAVITAIILYPKVVNTYEIRQIQQEYGGSYDEGIKSCILGGGNRVLKPDTNAGSCTERGGYTVPISGCMCDTGQCWDGETCVDK